MSNDSLTNSTIYSLYGTTLTPDQIYALSSLRIALGFFSALGSLLVLCLVVYFKMTSVSWRFVIILTVANFIQGICNIFSATSLDPNYGSVCIAQGFLLQFSQLATFGWTVVIVLNLYFVVVKGESLKYLESVAHVLVWSWCIFASFLPFYGQAYGVAGAWCWIMKPFQGYRWGLFYGPLFIQIIVILVLTILVERKIITILRQQTDENSAKARVVIHRLRAYPLIFIVLYFFPVVNRLHDAFSSTDSYPLLVLQCLTATSIGYINAIAYLLSEEIRTKLVSMSTTSRDSTEPGDNGNIDINEEISISQSELSEHGFTQTSDDLEKTQSQSQNQY